jgi:transcriptional regulator with XRE-family HTH domain
MGSRVLHRPAYRRFCQLLRRYREEAGLTQRQLADLLGQLPSYVHKSEVGDRRVDPLEFAAWCRACGRPAGRTLDAAVRELE